MASVSEQRLRLIGSLHRGFDLNDAEASALAEALRRGGPLAQVMHSEIVVSPAGRFDVLSDELRAYLVGQGVETRWVTLLVARIRPQFKYIYYILRDGETYGAFALSATPV